MSVDHLAALMEMLMVVESVYLMAEHLVAGRAVRLVVMLAIQ
jgi:hypothetical protein